MDSDAGLSLAKNVKMHGNLALKPITNEGIMKLVKIFVPVVVDLCFY